MASISMEEKVNIKPTVPSNLATKLINGAIAGVTGTLIIFPIDMVKTRLQNQKKVDGKYPHNGGVDCFRKIVSKEGAKGLYRGLIPNLIGVTPEKAIKLAVNDLTRESLAARLSVTPDELPIQYGMLAGATAGFCQVIATNPMEIVKIRMQVAGSNLAPGATRPTAIQIVKDLGLRGMYKGTAATLLRDVPFSILFFPSHAYLKQKFASEDGTTSFSAVFGSGIIAGAIAAAAVTPSDVIKTRLQVAAKSGDVVYTGYWNCLKTIVATEGPSALFRGAGARALIVAPLFGIALLTYEVQQKLFKK
ncbi:mitochondrial carrier [Neoconidiobolus thromboides FSU 785]|nr:mitochondrial carrier [Neoconidiobolus thromboides FSU 785]